MDEVDQRSDPKPSATGISTPMLETTADRIDTTASPTDDADMIEESATTILPQQQMIVDLDDIWATSEGYTPLQDFNIMNTANSNDVNADGVPSGTFFSDGTTGGTIFTSFPGDFYSNLAQQQEEGGDTDWGHDDENDADTGMYHDYNYLHNEDNDDDDDDDGGEIATTATTTTTNTTSTSFYDSIPDYRSVADNALSILDREYLNIISLEQRKPSQADIDDDDDDYDDENEIPVDNSKFGIKASIESNTSEGDRNSTDDFATLDLFPQQEAKVEKHIDTEAVRRAVQTIQLKNPKLQQNLRAWERKQHLQHNSIPSTPYTQIQKCMAPRVHPIIPELPLTAFRKYTSPKAIQATANLTRSVCIAEAIHRFNILQHHVDQEQTIRIHVLGCDHVEIGYHNIPTKGNATTSNDDSIGYDVSRIRTVFGPVVRWLGAYAEAPSHIRIELIGPNIPTDVGTTMNASPIDLLPNKELTNNNNMHPRKVKECLQSASLRCHAGTYEDILKNETNDIGVPDVAIAFNAGIWGYQEWATTIRYLIQQPLPSIPLVITAYTFEEAEDDYDTISEIVKECSNDSDHKKHVQCVWDVEHNPFASNQDYQAHSSVSVTNMTSANRRRENMAWQAWRI